MEEFIEEIVEEVELPPEIEIEPTKVYIEVNSNNEIIKVFSTDFEQPTEKSIYLNEGYGDKYRHAQSQYFEKPLMNDDGFYNYNYKDGKVIEKE